jgi:hypothetical protein
MFGDAKQMMPAENLVQHNSIGESTETQAENNPGSCQ